jgi:hypothetical protein
LIFSRDMCIYAISAVLFSWGLDAEHILLKLLLQSKISQWSLGSWLRHSSFFKSIWEEKMSHGWY